MTEPSAKIIDGRAFSADLRARIAEQVTVLSLPALRRLRR